MTDLTKKATFSSPPKLSGYYYSPGEARDARDTGKLLSIRLETSLQCNLRCNYCCNNSGEALADELSYAQLLDLVRQAKALDAQSIVVIGGGEPTIYPHFEELISFIHARDMVPVVFTNTTTMTRDLAQFLLDHNASVIGKLDSLQEDVQDRMVGVKGTYGKIRRGIEQLMSVGFSDTEDPAALRLGLSFVINKLNIGELPDLWRYCRERNIFPNLDMMIPNQRAERQVELLPTREERQAAKLVFLELDRREHGFE